MALTARSSAFEFDRRSAALENDAGDLFFQVHHTSEGALRCLTYAFDRNDLEKTENRVAVLCGINRPYALPRILVEVPSAGGIV